MSFNDHSDRPRGPRGGGFGDRDRGGFNSDRRGGGGGGFGDRDRGGFGGPPRSGNGPRPPRPPMAPLEDLGEATVTVKWFNPVKGFGFAAWDAQGQDVFIPGRLVPPHMSRDLVEGFQMNVKLGKGSKGPQVTEIIEA